VDGGESARVKAAFVELTRSMAETTRVDPIAVVISDRISHLNSAQKYEVLEFLLTHVRTTYALPEEVEEIITLGSD
jgi:hypothetical protein